MFFHFITVKYICHNKTSKEEKTADAVYQKGLYKAYYLEKCGHGCGSNSFQLNLKRDACII